MKKDVILFVSGVVLLIVAAIAMFCLGGGIGPASILLPVGLAGGLGGMFLMFCGMNTCHCDELED